MADSSQAQGVQVLLPISAVPHGQAGTSSLLDAGVWRACQGACEAALGGCTG